jgi:PucR family transcriptional regulator, purine catabolism regulatory protein
LPASRAKEAHLVEAHSVSGRGSVVDRVRAVHLRMVDAVLGGDGLEGVAALAAGETGGVVAIVVPRLGAAASSAPVAELAALRRYVSERSRGRTAAVPPGVAAEVPIASGDERLGAVLLLGDEEPAPDALEFLHVAAVACLTEVAVEEARLEVEQNLRGSFLEELRGRDDLEVDDVLRRAARLGCDLSRGAVALCAELSSDRPRHVVATIAGEYPGALAQHMEGSGRVYALLPGSEATATLAAARRLAARLQRHGTVGLSSFYGDVGDLGRAIQEAELVLDVLRRSDVPIAEDIGTGTYRLLFRVLASHPEEVRSFYEDTVAPLVAYDAQYATDLVGTLSAYLEHNCNMNATASAIYAHRHTVAYRLERVKELTGLDPLLSEDRERLGLGLKAYRIIAPRLHR